MAILYFFRHFFDSWFSRKLTFVSLLGIDTYLQCVIDMGIIDVTSDVCWYYWEVNFKYSYYLFLYVFHCSLFSSIILGVLRWNRFIQYKISDLGVMTSGVGIFQRLLLYFRWYLWRIIFMVKKNHCIGNIWEVV